MSALRKEWTEKEIKDLKYDMRVAKIKVLEKWGFTVEEIGKVLELPTPVIAKMLEG